VLTFLLILQQGSIAMLQQAPTLHSARVVPFKSLGCWWAVI